jgi:hypothetical protein
VSLRDIESVQQASHVASKIVDAGRAVDHFGSAMASGVVTQTAVVGMPRPVLQMGGRCWMTFTRPC